MSASKNDLKIGMAVKGKDGKSIGKISEITSDTFDVESGVLVNHIYSIAFSEVSSVTADGVVLNVAEAEFERLRNDGHLGVTLKERAAGVVDHTKQALHDAAHPSHLPKPEKS
jgi:hypothetical protein